MVRAIVGLSLTLSILSSALVAQDAQNPDNPSLSDRARQERERKKNPGRIVLTNAGSAAPGPTAGQQPPSVPAQSQGASHSMDSFKNLQTLASGQLPEQQLAVFTR